MRTAKQIAVENGKYVVREADISSDKVQGSDKMRSVGGGVQARLVKLRSNGTYVIESIYFDRDRFNEDSIQAWLEKHEKSILESMRKIQESAPAGSFTDIAMRVQRALSMSEFFNDAYCCMQHIFPSFTIVEYKDKLYKVEYSESEGRIELSDPKMVDVEFVAKEVAAYKEKHDRQSRPNFEFRDQVAKVLSIRETDTSKREIVCVLIEHGMNYSKKRYYPKETLQRATESFSGLKMYMDHPTEEEERSQPERSIGDWIATIKETWYEDGKIMARVHVHDDWLWEKLQDKTFREHIALSINASGRSYYREIEGQTVQVVEQITSPESVDWVTEPGARGRVEYLLEKKQKEGDIEMLNTVKLEEMKKARPDLVESIEKEVRERMKGENETQIKEAVEKAVEAAVKPFKEGEAKRLTESIKAKCMELVGKSALPKKGIPAFVEKFIAGSKDLTESNLEEKVKEAVKAEVQYLNDLGAGIKIGIDPGTPENESSELPAGANVGLYESCGVAPEKKKDA